MIGLVPRDHWEYNVIDLIYALVQALIPKRQNNRIEIARVGSCIPIRSGRAGLVLAIRSLELPLGARIGVPLYCCPIVFKAIVAAGCRPYFIDVDPTTFCISTEDLFSKRSQIEALIAIHMFGNMCNMPVLQEVLEGKPIIEDCAQALGSSSHDRVAGSFGKVAFYSFRSGKYLSVGEGGALFSPDTELSLRISQMTDKLTIPKYEDELVHTVKTYVKSLLRSKPLYGIAGYHLWQALNLQLHLSEKSSISLSQVFLSDLAIIKERLPVLDLMIKRQRSNAQYYSDNLDLDAAMLCSEKPGTFYNRYYYPITFPSKEHRDFVSAYMFEQRVDTIKYLDDISSVATKYYGYKGTCPESEQLAKKVLIIPNYYSLKQKDVHHIARCLNQGWAEARRLDQNIIVESR